MRFATSYIFTLLAVMAASLPVSAETVSQKQASKLAQTFFNAANGRVMAKPKLVYNGKRLTTRNLFSPFYVYNHPAGGFVIISAENKAFPILGYSLKDNFNPDEMGDATKALLTEYARHIEYIRYDSRIPEEAIEAWTNFPQYLDNLLEATYDATDPTFTMEEASERIDAIETSDRIYDLSSDIFTPSQWQSMVDEELKSAGSVALGLVGDKLTSPAIIHGHKGDYYRIELDSRNNWLMRLMATEFLSTGQVADLGNPIRIEMPEEEDIPFALHDEFIAQTAAEEEARLDMFDELLHPSSPVVRYIGGGHYQITLPAEVMMARIYNLQGAMVDQLTFRGSDTAVIKLDRQPSGFYMLLLNDVNGRPYGLKLHK